MDHTTITIPEMHHHQTISHHHKKHTKNPNMMKREEKRDSILHHHQSTAVPAKNIAKLNRTTASPIRNSAYLVVIVVLQRKRGEERYTKTMREKKEGQMERERERFKRRKLDGEGRRKSDRETECLTTSSKNIGHDKIFC